MNSRRLQTRQSTEVKAEYNQQIKDLFLKKEELQNKVAKIRKASGNAWEDMKAGTELSWEVFQDSVKSSEEQIIETIYRADSRTWVQVL